jgi:transcriptional regulator with XRE-family HTH domain
MVEHLDNLSELIDRHLPAQGMNREGLAKALGVSPSTLSRWSSRMPGPETVRALAAALDQPYGTVLAAALRSGGYAETTSDILAGHRLTLAARDPACSLDDESDGAPGAVFTDPERAQRWAHVREELDRRRADYGHGGVAAAPVVIDGAVTPAHVVVYRADWEHRTDAVTVSESGVFAQAPSGLDPLTAHVNALSGSGEVFAVWASGLDAAVARQTVEAVVSRLRAEGKLLGTDASTGLGFVDHLVHAELGRLRDDAAAWRGVPAADVEPTVESPLRARAHLGDLIAKISPRHAQVPYVWGADAKPPTDVTPVTSPVSTYRLSPLRPETY